MDEEDYEKILMERETSKYEEKIQKARIREAMLARKSEGYSRVNTSNEPLIKTFLGYISELHSSEKNGILDALIDCIKNESECKRINFILANKIKKSDVIIKILVDGPD